MPNNMTIDDLAVIIKDEFGHVNERFDKVDQRFDKVESDIKELKDGHERLELRMSNVAYRFEVDDLKNQLNLLRQRVDKMESK
ncbi:MAG: hypothetical protein PHF50_02265 [Patescibacteria group bacterium]|nr:hypothetical protein [Patescibacteria group bacterium]